MRKLAITLLSMIAIVAQGQFWKPLNNGLEGAPSAIYAENGRLYTAVPGKTLNGKKEIKIQYWNGLFWNKLPTFITNEAGNVNQILIYNKQLYLAGTFQGVNANNQNFYITRLNGTRYETLPAFDVKITSFKSVTGMAIYDNQLVISGDFANSLTNSLAGLVFYDGNEIVPNPKNLGNTIDGKIFSIAAKDDLLVVGGDFSEINLKQTDKISVYKDAWLEIENNFGIPKELVIQDSIVFYYSTSNKPSFYTINKGKTAALNAGLKEIVSISDLVATDTSIIASGSFILESGMDKTSLIEFYDGKWHEISNGNLPAIEKIAVDKSLFSAGDYSKYENVNLNYIAEYMKGVGAIKGEVFLDKNDDCIMNNRDEPIQDFLIKISPGDFVIRPKEDGSFVKLLPAGKYTVQILIGKYWQPTNCSSLSKTVEVVAGEVDDHCVFALKQQIGINDLTVHLTSNSGWSINNNKVVGYNLKYANKGSVDYSERLVTLKFDKRLTGLVAYPKPTKVFKDSAVWKLEDLQSGEKGNIRLRFNFNSAILDDVKLMSRIQNESSDVYEGDNVSELEQVINYTDDPFVKQSYSSFTQNDTAYLSAIDSMIQYVVAFSNYTTDTVRTVHIVDTIRLNHSLTYIQDIGSSHDCQSRIIPGLPGSDLGVLIFTCPDVNLVPNPLKISDEFDDQGHIAFEIGLKKNMAEGSLLRNRATVVFDDQIFLTNWAYGYVNSQLVSIKPFTKNRVSKIYPNPATEMLKIELPQGQNYPYRVINQSGQIVLTGETENNQVSVRSLSNGSYSIIFENDKEMLYSKFVIVK